MDLVQSILLQIRGDAEGASEGVKNFGETITHAFEQPQDRQRAQTVSCRFFTARGAAIATLGSFIPHRSQIDWRR